MNRGGPTSLEETAAWLRNYEVALGSCLLLSVGCGGQTLNAGSNPPADGAADSGGETVDAGSSPPETTGGKLIFMSSKRYSANLGGLEGADAKCQSLAEAAGRSGVFRAWLSVISTSASQRLTHASERYILNTGVVVANDWADLTSGTLRHEVNETERKELAPPNAVNGCNPLVFWTATDERGSQYGEDCKGWTSTSADLHAQLGVISRDEVWSTFCMGAMCDAVAPIMCIEQ